MKQFKINDEILELAVKVIVNPIYGWVTSSIIIFGCRPIEVFSLKSNLHGGASVLNLNNKDNPTSRRSVIPIPEDFVNKLNIFDQISKPVSIENSNEYNKALVNKFIENWSDWLLKTESNLKLCDLRNSWAKRSINYGIDHKKAAESMGINLNDFQKKFL